MDVHPPEREHPKRDTPSGRFPLLAGCVDNEPGRKALAVPKSQSRTAAALAAERGESPTCGRVRRLEQEVKVTDRP